MDSRPAIKNSGSKNEPSQDNNSTVPENEFGAANPVAAAIAKGSPGQEIEFALWVAERSW